MKKRVKVWSTVSVLMIGMAMLVTLVGCGKPPEPLFDASRPEESLQEIGIYYARYKTPCTTFFITGKRVLEIKVMEDYEKYETYNGWTGDDIAAKMKEKYPTKYADEEKIVDNYIKKTYK